MWDVLLFFLFSVFFLDTKNAINDKYNDNCNTIVIKFNQWKS